ncbi:MAG: glycerophosphodiester phosphodiesterase [Roseitalea sp.]|jgi:glycerophosphoryl diester phosphodiesterase|nr:glycerophosphodiester phosphodiesterase [Roseitalea sp.]MBO6722252.1 glycerophosphodiester phosphodiesterase [Roseitalea sp.]MBO6744956.1 glycerophosphodiester phosphodiesterase [Roseitalea sp.]
MADLAFLTARPIAHRGLHDDNRLRWENTASAFRAALAGHFAIELDVQLSADGVAMAFHDAQLDRLTGEKGLVADRSAHELRTLAIGGTEDRIMTLGETLRLVDGAVPLVIEMKDNGARNGDLARAVVSDVAAYRGPVAVMSFEHALLDAFRAAGTGVPLGLTASGTSDAALAEHRPQLEAGIDFVSYQVAALPNAFVAQVRARGLPVITWTVRTPEQVALTRAHADQMTFEGFDPDAA